MTRQGNNWTYVILFRMLFELRNSWKKKDPFDLRLLHFYLTVKIFLPRWRDAVFLCAFLFKNAIVCEKIQKMEFFFSVSCLLWNVLFLADYVWIKSWSNLFLKRFCILFWWGIVTFQKLLICGLFSWVWNEWKKCANQQFCLFRVTMLCINF